MNLSRPFILRPVATTLLMIALFLSGSIAFRLLPVAALPEVDYPTIRVSTFYPGASPEVMTSSVTAPLERQFGQMPGLTRMISTGSGGASVITLRFSLNLSLDIAEQQVQAAINAASNFLPRDIPSPPIYSKVNPADSPILSIAVSSDTDPMRVVSDYVDTHVARKISRVDGVGLVSLSGGRRPAVRIRVDPEALASRGFDLEAVRAAVAEANTNTAKGGFDGESSASSIDANDQLLDAKEYAGVVIAYRNGAPVRIGDIAETVESAENLYVAGWSASADSGRKPAVILNVRRQPGANVITVADRIREMMPKLRQSLPESMSMTVLTDRTETIRASVEDVEFELALAVLLVVGVIYIFLRSFRATIIPGVAVPLSLVGAFGVMYLAGFSINNLTLMALTIATGFVVDDAIVMIENIARHIEEGEEPFAAALKGAKQIGFTIVSLTFSLIAVLIPLLFMGDVTGRIFREFAVTLAVAILISAVISLTLTPMMCARLLRRVRPEDEAPFHRAGLRAFEAVVRLYDRALGVALRWRNITLAVAAGTLALTAALYVRVPKGFFPTQDTGVIEGVIEARRDISFAAMARAQETADGLILRDPAVESVSSLIGVDEDNPTANTGRVRIHLKPLDSRDASAAEIANRIASSVRENSGLETHLRPVQDITADTSVSFGQYLLTLQSPDQATLDEWTGKVVATMRGLPQIADVTSDLADGGSRVRIEIDRTAAGRYGVTVAAIGGALHNALGQRIISTIFTQSSARRVVLEVAPKFREDVADLRRLSVAGSGGVPVRLENIAKFSEEPAKLAISRQGQIPAAGVSFNLAPGFALGDAVKAIRAANAASGMPVSVEANFEGAAESFEGSLTSQLWLVLASIVTMYIVLGVLYESFIHPVTILSTLPSAGIGALLALLIDGGELDVIGVIGIILLIGIVKKNAIMMIDFALEAERERGMSAEAAIREACLLRFRPIMMTTMAALFGALPLMLGSGMGAELRRPLGVTMVGGLVVSQVLTLFTTPAIYLAFDSIARRFRKNSPTETVSEEEALA